MELDLLDPLLLLLLVVGPEQELGAVAGVEPEHELPLGVVVRRLHARLEDHQRRTGGLGLEEVFLISEEAHQLATKNCVVGFPRSGGKYVVDKNCDQLELISNLIVALFPPVCNSCFLSKYPSTSTGGRFYKEF